MIALDTNVLVRVLVEDDKAQLGRVRALLNQAAEEEELAFVSDLVVVEIEWVLESAYKVPRQSILQAIQALLADSRFAFEDRARLTNALRLYQTGKGDLSDYLVGLRASEAGARTVYTFDRDLRDDEGFTLL